MGGRVEAIPRQWRLADVAGECSRDRTAWIRRGCGGWRQLRGVGCRGRGAAPGASIPFLGELLHPSSSPSTLLSIPLRRGDTRTLPAALRVTTLSLRSNPLAPSYSRRAAERPRRAASDRHRSCRGRASAASRWGPRCGSRAYGAGLIWQAPLAACTGFAPGRLRQVGGRRKAELCHLLLARRYRPRRRRQPPRRRSPSANPAHPARGTKLRSARQNRERPADAVFFHDPTPHPLAESAGRPRFCRAAPPARDPHRGPHRSLHLHGRGNSCAGHLPPAAASRPPGDCRRELEDCS